MDVEGSSGEDGFGVKIGVPAGKQEGRLKENLRQG